MTKKRTAEVKKDLADIQKILNEPTIPFSKVLKKLKIQKEVQQ